MMPSEDLYTSTKTAEPVIVAGRFRSLKTDFAWVFLAGLIIFLACPAPEFINLDARFAVFAQEMLRNGPSFFPTTYNTPYPDYPATSTFLCCLTSLPFGRVTPGTSVLPTAVVSALILVVIYGIGALQSRKRGVVAVLFALFTAEFVVASRSVTLDQFTSLATVLSFYLVYSSDRLGRSRRLWLLPLSWFLGFAFRGPVGLVIPATVTGVYYLGTAQFKRTAFVGIAAGCLLAVSLCGLLLAARSQGGMPFLKQVIAAQMTSRFGDRGPGFGYYWCRAVISYAVAYPLALLVVASRLRDLVRKRTEEDRFLCVLTLWVVAVLLLMSIPAAKKIRYVAPIIPAISLIASSLIVDASGPAFLSRTKRMFLEICNGLPGAMALAVGGLWVFACLRRPEWRTCSLVSLGLLIPLLCVSWKLDRGWRSVPDQDVCRLAVGVAACVVVVVGVAGPIQSSQERTGPFVRQVEALIEKKPGVVSFLRVGPDAEDVKFVANLRKPLEPQFVSSLEPLWGKPQTHYVITRESTFRSLRVDESELVRVLVRGRIGHRDFVVLGLDGLG